MRTMTAIPAASRKIMKSVSKIMVNRILQRLCAESILEFHYGRLRTINPDKLAGAVRTMRVTR